MHFTHLLESHMLRFTVLSGIILLSACTTDHQTHLVVPIWLRAPLMTPKSRQPQPMNPTCLYPLGSASFDWFTAKSHRYRRTNLICTLRDYPEKSARLLSSDRFKRKWRISKDIPIWIKRRSEHWLHRAILTMY